MNTMDLYRNKHKNVWTYVAKTSKFPSRRAMALREAAGMKASDMIVRSIRFWRRMSRSSPYQWRRKIARAQYRARRDRYFALIDAGLI